MTLGNAVNTADGTVSVINGKTCSAAEKSVAAHSGAGYRRDALRALGEVGGVLVRGRLVVGPPGGVLQAHDAGAAERSGGQGGAPHLMLLDFDRW